MGKLIIFPSMPALPDHELPNRIRIWRKRRRKSLQAVADDIGTTRATVMRLETGDRGVTLDWLRRLARSLDVAVSDLLLADDNRVELDAAELQLIEAVRAGGEPALRAAQAVSEQLRTFTPQPAPRLFVEGVNDAA